MTTLAEKQGAIKGSVSDIFLPSFISRNTFRYSTALFIIDLIILAIGYFKNSFSVS